MMFSLHIDTARTWRGGQNQVLLTVIGLREIGYRATLVAPRPDEAGRPRPCAARYRGRTRSPARSGARAGPGRSTEWPGTVPAGLSVNIASRSAGGTSQVAPAKALALAV